MRRAPRRKKPSRRVRRSAASQAAMTDPVEHTIRQLGRLRWRYRNLLWLAAGIMAAYFILRTDRLDAVVSEVRSMEYFGIFLSGLMYAFSITTAPATALFYKLGSSFDPLAIAAVGALGTVLGDYLIFRFVRDNLMQELRALTGDMSRLGKACDGAFRNSVFYDIFPFSNLLLWKKFRLVMPGMVHSKAWRTAVLVAAGAVILLPVPDEIGIAMMGAARLRTRNLLVASYVLNFVGIFMIAWLGGA
ncbi:MAG: hypothetical protein NT016_03570 [Candidatus Aenigmarchaeota archaeon]|nr:hypothetical protein [Candidatus Aenigmarchaeota archaeon]